MGFVKPPIEPYNTLALASDENFQVLVRLDYKTYTIEVGDPGFSTAQKTVSGVSGVVTVDIGTPIDLGLTEGAITPKEVRVKDSSGNIVATQIIKLFYITSTNGDLNFKDSLGNDIIGEVALIDAKNGLVRRYYGSVITIPALDTNGVLDYEKMYVEFASHSGGKKYYYLSRVSDIPTLGVSTVVQLEPKDHYIVTAEVKLDVENTDWWGQFLDYIADSLGFMMQFAQYLSVGPFLARYYPQVAVWITKNLGIGLPITGVEYDSDNNILKISYWMDPVDKLVVVAIVVGAIVAGIIAVSLINAYVETLQTIRYIKATDLIVKTNEMCEELFKTCYEHYSDNPEQLEKCLTYADRLCHEARDTSSKVLDDTYKDYKNTQNELDTLKQILYVGGGIAIIVSLMGLAKK